MKKMLNELSLGIYYLFVHNQYYSFILHSMILCILILFDKYYFIPLPIVSFFYVMMLSTNMLRKTHIDAYLISHRRNTHGKITPHFKSNWDELFLRLN